MGSPRHLWAGAWRAESDRPRDEGTTTLPHVASPDAEEPGAEAPPPDAPPAARRGGLLLGALLVLIAVAGGAFAAGMLLDGGSDAPPDPLPAVASRPIRPRAGQTRAGAIYAAASPAVVSIRTTTGQGTGFLIDDDGTLVTNAHVVGDSTHVVVRFGSDGASIDGDVLGTDPSSDLAVVSIEASRIPRGVKPLRFADSSQVQVGDLAVAIGNPFGLDRTATEGIVSGLGRSITAPNGFEIDEVIQTDAPINPGNSGGPLLDAGGRVIGVNSQIATAGMGSQGNIGIGFAVPSNTVREIVPVLRRGESVPRPYLGVRTRPTSLLDPNGAVIEDVTPGGPAAKAGLRPGDVITRVDGRAVREPSDVAAGIADHEPGDEVTVVVRRDGREESVRAKLGTRPERAP